MSKAKGFQLTLSSRDRGVPLTKRAQTAAPMNSCKWTHYSPQKQLPHVVYGLSDAKIKIKVEHKPVPRF